MPEEPFFERFRRILEERGIRPEHAASIMETSVDVVRRLSDGRTKQARFDEALRLCERLGIDPWYLAFGRERAGFSPLVAPAPTPSTADFQRLEDEIVKTQERVDQLTGMVQALAEARAATLEAEVAAEQQSQQQPA